MAAFSKLEIDTGRLQSDIESLKSNLSRMRNKGETMMAGINALSGMWEGEAKNAFTLQFKADYETLRSMEEVIEDLIKDLEYAKQEYIKCENNVGSIVSSIRV